MYRSQDRVEKLVAVLQEQFGDSLRSCVEYQPTSKRIYYLREDIEQSAAEGRLVRVENLYQTQRVNREPIGSDPTLGPLEASIHLFEGAVVVHLTHPSGTVVGFSLDPDALPDLQSLVAECFETAFDTDRP